MRSESAIIEHRRVLWELLESASGQPLDVLTASSLPFSK
jgi:hypothetical protein